MTSEDIISDLIARAETAEHRQFHLLESWRDYTRAKKLRRAERFLVYSIRQSVNRLFRNYCKSVNKGDSAVLTLIAYCTSKKVLRFYEEELNILSDMITEYEYYLAAGNFIDFIFALPRPADKLWDHRGL